jgi:heat shock protein HslJ
VLRYAIHSAAIALAVLATACGSTRDAVGPTDTASETSADVIKTLQVASTRVECTGVAIQSCLQVRESSAAPWTLLYDRIVGFDYEPGYLYEIRVKEEAVANPPADGSSVRRTLVSIVSKSAAPPALIGPTWRLASINGREALPGVRVTAVFGADDRVAGTAGCNRYVGRGAASGSRLDVGPLAMTRMFCGADGVMDQEQAYVAALENAKAYRIDGARLTLGRTSGSATLVFRLE